MISSDILKKIRRIEILCRKTSTEIFAGEYHSAFKGRGMEFSEVREYHFGDDIRFVDWNVSSRMGRLFVKQFVEERELTVILAVDLSASLSFFSGRKSKMEIAAELSAIVAFTAMLNHDKVGLLIFTDRIERFIPPKKGRVHLLRIIREILTFTPEGRGTAIDKGLVYLNKVLKKKAILFLVSDFIDRDFTTSLKVASQKHDLIAIRLIDPREKIPPRRGLFILKDSESGEEFFADFGDKRIRSGFEQIRRERRAFLDDLFKKYGIDSITIDDEENTDQPLFDLFLKRKRKIRR